VTVTPADTAQRRAHLSPVQRALLERRMRGVTPASAAGRPGLRSGASLPAIVPAPADRYQPFPLTDLQQAYWIGRGDAFELGNIACHVYFEFDTHGLDCDRLETAWRRLIERHDMLRAVVGADGRQRVLAEVPPYRIERLDLRGAASEVVEQRREALRAELSHQVLPPDHWPLFDLRATRLTDDRTLIHWSFDLLIADYWSFQILLREMMQLYLNPEAALPPLALGFRDYVLALEALRESEAYARDLAYWRERSAVLPPGPVLPLAVDPSAVARPRFAHRRWRFEPEAWRRLKRRGTRAGLTPSGVMMAAFAEVLAAWTRDPEYTLNVTLFHRLPLHPQVGEIVGDFTSVTLLGIDRRPGETFTERARRWQESLWQDMGHALVSGVRVMREMAREGRQPFGAVMPVVFTSALSNAGAGAPAGLPDPMSSAGEMVYSVSQTPQVWLNNQVFEEQGTVAFNWEVVEELFPAGMLDAMFRAYVELLEELTDDDACWDRRSTPAEPASGSGRAATAVRPPRPREAYVAPDNEVEQRLVAMWEDLLRVERVGADDDFIALGGCSLQATRLLARVHADFGATVRPRRFFERPTVRWLAQEIAAQPVRSGLPS
jgi:hypothetical protein